MDSDAYLCGTCRHGYLYDQCRTCEDEIEARHAAKKQIVAELRRTHEAELQRINEVHASAYRAEGAYRLTNKEEHKEESDRLFAEVRADLTALRNKLLGIQ